jgi:transglutaminase-like putative cysteine protease
MTISSTKQTDPSGGITSGGVTSGGVTSRNDPATKTRISLAPQRFSRPPIAANLIVALAAAAATIGAATSLSSVVAGWAWFGFVTATALVVASTGLALRALRAPTPVVGLGQLVILSFLVTAAFTRTGIAGVIMGPASFSELNEVLVNAFAEIRTGLPPVPSSPAILCLVTIAIGLVAILVDTLAVSAQAPAATGLVLLCVYAVPASLSDSMLPWWTFLLGAIAFVGLLAVDGGYRKQQWRNETSHSAARPNLATTSISGTGFSGGFSAAPVAIVAIALTAGLVVGVAATAVGTVGRLPGNSGTGQGNGTGGFGVNAFTSLRGMLDQSNDVELFRVRGLGADKTLMRAFTLDTFQPNQGWSLPEAAMPAGVPAGGRLPLAAGDDGTGNARQIHIEPTNWVDVWMPMYGSPRAIENVNAGWFYDRDQAAVYSEHRQRIPAYTESAWVSQPSKESLRAAKSGANEVSPLYTQMPQVDPRVAALAAQVTQGQTTDFDKATALWQFFTAQNRFTYDTRTAAAADADALVDFLFNGKRGYCEQFASAMAVMLRVLHIPTRVAVGFTSGVQSGDYRSITSKDAHAWVEVYFPGQGWVSFDPTPRSDGRGTVPDYLRNDTSAGTTTGDTPNSTNQPAAPSTAGGSDTGQSGNSVAAPHQQGGETNWIKWGLLVVLIMALLITAIILVSAALARRRTGLSTKTTNAKSLRAKEIAETDGASARIWLRFIAAALWIAALGLALWLWSSWVAIILVVLLIVASSPLVIREVIRQRRLTVIRSQDPDAATAAWQELLDDCVDRGIPVQTTGTARSIAQDLIRHHDLEEADQAPLNTVVSGLERSWYSAAPEANPHLAPAFTQLREDLRRQVPLPWWARIFPKSVWRKSWLRKLWGS